MHWSEGLSNPKVTKTTCSLAPEVCRSLLKLFGFIHWHANAYACQWMKPKNLKNGFVPFTSFSDILYKAAVCLCDFGIRESFVSVHISFVALRKTFCYWLSFKAMHWINIISKFSTFPYREFNLVISWTFISFFFSLVYIERQL